MRKNLPLYILLIFLIVVNGFFLYNYLGLGAKDEANGTKRPENFLVKELRLDALQKEQFRALGRKHRQRMQKLSDDIIVLKDELFKGLSDDSLKNINIDSIAHLIGENEAAKDLEVLRHFKSVQELCNNEQKETFSKIIEDALKRGSRDQGPPKGERLDGNRPRPNASHGNRPPPPER